MNLLVTRGAGFIGSNLVRTLLRGSIAEGDLDGGKVVNLDKLTYPGNRENLKGVESDPRHVFVEGDIVDRKLVGCLLRDYDIDAIAHLAAESHVDHSIDSPEEFFQTNVLGTFSLLESARAFTTKRTGGRSNSSTFRPTRSTAHSTPNLLPLPKIPATLRTVPTALRRPLVIISSVPTGRPMVCLFASRTVRTTAGPGSSIAASWRGWSSELSTRGRPTTSEPLSQNS